MNKTIQLSFDKDLMIEGDSSDWTFNGASTREYTHCFHDYPARMIPQIARKLLNMFSDKNMKNLFDPYCGTGSSLVEGFLYGLDVIGTDLNPLARLIAKAKTSILNIKILDRQLNDFLKTIQNFHHDITFSPPIIEGIKRLDFWFKPDVIEKLTFLKRYIDSIDDEDIKLFFKIGFSETVRESSNTRNDEFKLYRYDSIALEKFAPNVFEIMSKKLLRNKEGMLEFLSALRYLKNSPSSIIYDFDSVVSIPDNYIPDSSVDIVITSPPYGDSKTTVAYGQYSHLSSAWLGLENPSSVDRKLMGGKKSSSLHDFPSSVLINAIDEIAQKDYKRALEVSSFYSDLYFSIRNISYKIKKNGICCYVVGNRKIKGVLLPTDLAIRDFFMSCGFSYLDTFHRTIPNKRMPLKNSPTNISGIIGDTMTKEQIVILKK